MTSAQRRAALCALVALAQAGCVVGPKYQAPAPAAPASLAAANAPASNTPLGRVSEDPADMAAWWRGFGDAELVSLVDRAMTGNLDRHTAAARVREASALSAATRAELYPTISANPGYDYTRISSNAGLSSIGQLISGKGGPASAGFPGLAFDTYTLGLTASWTPDVFGGTRSALAAARAREAAQVWSARDTEVTVAADVAQAYFALREDQARLAVVRANAAQQKDLLDVIEARVAGGIVNEIDTAQQRSQLETTTAQIAPLEADAAVRAHQLAVLLGMAPDALAAELAPRPEPLAALPAAQPVIPIGLTSDILERRPDVREAERNLAASVADVDQATAALYPQIQLTGTFDLVSSALRTLVEASSRNEVTGASLVQTLFDGGRLRAQKRQTQARAEEAAIAYRKAVLMALQQAADALARYAADQRQIVALESGYADAGRAARLDRAQYLGGVADLQATLRAQGVALGTQEQLIVARAQMSTDLVALYKALGGGWSPGAPPVAPATGR